MMRIITERSDDLNDIEAAKDVMLSAFTNDKQMIVVAINYNTTVKPITLYTKHTQVYNKEYVTT